MAISSGSRRTLLRFVDPESSAVEIFSVQRLLRSVGVAGVRELDEREAPRSPGLAIRDDVARIDGTVFLEFLSKDALTRLERQVAHVKFLTQCHVLRCTKLTQETGPVARHAVPRCHSLALAPVGPPDPGSRTKSGLGYHASRYGWLEKPLALTGKISGILRRGLTGFPRRRKGCERLKGPAPTDPGGLRRPRGLR